MRLKLSQLLIGTVFANSWVFVPKRNWEKNNGRRKNNESVCKSKHLSALQQRLCKRSLDHMKHVNTAAERGILECQNQFSDVRWNCSATRERENDDIFGRISKIGSKESAFISAITSASLVRTVAKACRTDLVTCGCDSSSMTHLQQRPATLSDHMEWDPCGDDFGYAEKWSKQFIDANDFTEKYKTKSCLERAANTGQGCTSRRTSRQIPKTTLFRKLARIQMSLKNNDVGRQEAVSSRKRECKCHGPSGSCSSMTCWYELPDMKIIGNRLKELYDNAQLMKWRRKRGNSDGNVDVELFPKQLPSRSGSRVNRKTSPPNPLIYVSKSPNFCEPDKKRGILGTSGRQCNRDSEGPDGCKELCCNRGYYSTNQTITEPCNCKFEWCCSVKCQECVKTVKISYCK